MRILIPMTYFRPYVSGPIIYVENLTEELVRRGHTVTILTSRHDTSLARRETLAPGIEIVRVPVLARLSKGTVTPGFLFAAWGLLGKHDAALVQVPQLESPGLALLARLRRRTCILTYHCDVLLPPGRLNRFIGGVLGVGHRLAARWSTAIAAYTQDYASHSPVMSRHLDKVTVVPPPAVALVATDKDEVLFRDRFGLGDRPLVGIAARLSAEKGFHRLLDALPELLDEWPDLCLVHAGEAHNVVGEEPYRESLQTSLNRWRDHWVSTGVLGPADLAAFYRACTVTTLPSINHTEAFGLVQIESMINGTPVIASALPGVRVPVSRTGMGLLIPTTGTDELVEALRQVLRDPTAFSTPKVPIADLASVSACVAGYELLLGILPGADRADPAS